MPKRNQPEEEDDLTTGEEGDADAELLAIAGCVAELEALDSDEKRANVIAYLRSRFVRNG